MQMLENIKEAKAIAKYVRVSPLKARRIADLVRGKSVDEAIVICRLNGNKPARAMEKVLRSAAANAENNHNMDVDKLYVHQVMANQGPSMKRMKALSHGRGVIILKRSSHLSVVLRERN